MSGDDDLTNILNSLLDAGDIVDLMADVATAAFPMPPQPVMQPSMRQLSPEFQFPPNNHRHHQGRLGFYSISYTFTSSPETTGWSNGILLFKFLSILYTV